MKGRRVSGVLGIAAVALIAATRAWSITDEEAWQSLRFHPPIPGARAAAMGGAGLALVDDPGASAANPARLAAISHEMIFFEGQFENPGGTRSADEEYLDASVNPLATTRLDSTASASIGFTPAFLGYARPFRLLDRPLVVAGSRTQWLDLDSRALSTTRTTPLATLPTPGAGDEVVRISRSDLDLSVEVWSASAGWRLSPTFAVGAGLQLARLSLSSQSVGFLADPLQFTGPGMVDPTFASSTAVPLIETHSDGSDTAPGLSFGAWWKPHPALSVASVYRPGARFEVEASAFDHLNGTSSSFENRVRLPDAAVVGVAWTPLRRSVSGLAQSLTVALDIERFSAGDIAEGMVAGRSIQTSAQFAGSSAYTLDDAIEVRAGAEMRTSFPGWVLSMRGGIYTEHETRPALARLSGDTGALTGQSAALERAGFLAAGGTEPHLTLGAGARFHALSCDLALDIADPGTRVVVSASWSRR